MALDQTFFTEHFPEEAASGRGGIAIPPPLPPRPIQWRRARRLVRELLADPSQTEKVFELLEAVGGPGDERTFQAFARRPEGRRLLAEKPSLVDVLSDREVLAALPAASLGRAYLEFAKRNGFAADGLRQANERGLGHLNVQLDPHRRWFYDRVGAVHDLWHVLSGYGTDEAGEVALLAFSMGQGLVNRGLWLLIATAAALAPKADGFAFQRYLAQAWRRGRRAGPLFVQPYEVLLAERIDAVRRALRITPPRVAHPGGIYRGSRESDGHDLQREAL